MTQKFQYSKKFDDGGIFVVGGETIEEFEANYVAVKASDIVRHLLIREDVAPAQQSAPSNSQPTANPQTDAERIILPDDAVLTVVWEGEKYHGEISPFPGTQYAVKVWPEVLDNAPGFNKDTTRTIKVGGWEVDFVRYEGKNGKMYPDKVVAIGGQL